MPYALLLAACVIFGSVPAKATEAVFAGGCFWCMESEFDGMEGIQSVVSGYTGGSVENPSYKDVSHGHTGHKEAVKITYDPDKVSYKQLLEVFWSNVDPFDDQGQFCDKGEQYRSAIFVSNEDERALAEQTKEKIAKRFKKKVVTEILDTAPFYPAEEYHQGYYKKNPDRYGFYRFGCGRDRKLEKIWGHKKKEH